MAILFQSHSEFQIIYLLQTLFQKRMFPYSSGCMLLYFLTIKEEQKHEEVSFQYF